MKKPKGFDTTPYNSFLSSLVAEVFFLLVSSSDLLGVERAGKWSAKSPCFDSAIHSQTDDSKWWKKRWSLSHDFHPFDLLLYRNANRKYTMGSMAIPTESFWWDGDSRKLNAHELPGMRRCFAFVVPGTFLRWPKNSKEDRFKLDFQNKVDSGHSPSTTRDTFDCKFKTRFKKNKNKKNLMFRRLPDSATEPSKIWQDWRHGVVDFSPWAGCAV